MVYFSDKYLNSLFNFAGIASKEPIEKIPTEYEINRDFIKETLPNLKWNKREENDYLGLKGFKTTIEEIDYKSFLKEISNKFPKYEFIESITKYEKSTYYSIFVRNVFPNNKYYDMRVYFYESELADMIRVLDKIKNDEIEIVDNYKGIRIQDKYEVGIYINRNKRIESTVKEKNIEYSFRYNGHKLGIILTKNSKYIKSLFTDLSFNTPDAILAFEYKFENSIELNEFLRIIETTINLRLYEDYNDMVELSKVYEKDNKKISTGYVTYGDNTPLSIGKNELKILNPVLLSYLQNVLRVNLLPFQYLGYYHILEYFFNDDYKEYIIKKIESCIDNKYEGLIDVIDTAKQLRKEEQMLLLVLKKYITLESFLKYFTFSKKYIPQKSISENIVLQKIMLNDEDKFIKALAKRFYLLRNEIVHSKNKRIIYSKNKSQQIRGLYDEVRLIRWVAETVIAANTEIITK